MDENLLKRYIEGTISSEEVEKVVDWLDEDPAHVREYMATHKLFDIAVLTSMDEQKPAVKIPVKPLYRKVVFEVLKIVAIFLLFWGGLHLIDTSSVKTTEETAFQTIYVPSGQRAELTLPDQTKVWLNAGSRLTYPTHFEKGVRRVKLNGEAYFNVTHNHKQPFIVSTEKLDVKVLGTEFNVLAYTSVATEISLLKGSVELSLPDLSQTYKMKPKEHVRLSDSGLLVSTIEDYTYFKWKEGLICFNNESVGHIIEKLQLYYDVKIEVQKKGLINSHYSGKFRTKDGIEQVLKVLQIEHKFTYTKDNDLNLITIK